MGGGKVKRKCQLLAPRGVCVTSLKLLFSVTSSTWTPNPTSTTTTNTVGSVHSSGIFPAWQSPSSSHGSQLRHTLLRACPGGCLSLASQGSVVWHARMAKGRYTLAPVQDLLASLGGDGILWWFKAGTVVSPGSMMLGVTKAVVLRKSLQCQGVLCFMPEDTKFDEY